MFIVVGFLQETDQRLIWRAEILRDDVIFGELIDYLTVSLISWKILI